MSDTLIFYVGVAVFILMWVGIGLTVYAFHRAGSEPVRGKRSRTQRARDQSGS